MSTIRVDPSKTTVGIAVLGYGSVMVALTLLKSFFVVGLLWERDAQRNRSLSLVPFNDLFQSEGWFIPLFGYGGNFAFFVPFGMLLYVLLHKRPAALFQATLFGALLSLIFEICQFVFTLGYSDIDDLIFNSAGAFVGALLAKAFGHRFFGVWVWLAVAATLVFLVLVMLGPRLGDPDKVAAPAPSSASAVGI